MSLWRTEVLHRRVTSDANRTPVARHLLSIFSPRALLQNASVGSAVRGRKGQVDDTRAVRAMRILNARIVSENMAAIFRLYRLRFHFVSAEPVYYPHGRASNVIRGALGTILHGIACVPDCPGARSCALRATCAYARIFEPAGWDAGPSGLQDPPRPFVLRASHLDGVTVAAGQTFFFDVHLFLTVDPPLEYFLSAFSQLAETGLGPSRGRVRLEAVDVIGKDPGAAVEARIFGQGRFVGQGLPDALEFPLAGEGREGGEVRVKFVTPLELKQKGRIATRPEFGLLMTRIAERLSNLCAMYGGEPLDWDWRGVVARAQAVSLVDWRVGPEAEAVRFSTKTGQRHSVGGLTGEAVYRGAGIREFLPVLEAAKYCGVGRHTVWGNGVLELGCPRQVDS